MGSIPKAPLGVLLTMGDYWGTLAAARDFGRAGYRVVLADARRWVPTAHSRFTQEQVPCPQPQDWSAFISWLFDYGRKRPGLLLYPTSDDTAWLFAEHAAALQDHFVLYQPDVRVIYNLLNKQLLHMTCKKLQIETPRTWYPQSQEEVQNFRVEESLSLLLKPRTQIGLEVGYKGRLLAPRDHLASVYRRFQQQLSYRPELLSHDPKLQWPMIQEYHPSARNHIVSLAGYIDRSGHMSVRSSRKILQRPRRLGIGLCFEAIPVDPRLLDAIRRICLEVGYFGVFESEFIADGDRRLLIDFNPRFYGQMGFEIARGLHSPALAAADAFGQETELWALANAGDGERRPVYSTRWLLRLSLLAGWLSRKHSWSELQSWRQWRTAPEHRYIDALYSRDDPSPYYIDMLITLARYARHPRDTIRKFFFDT